MAIMPAERRQVVIAAVAACLVLGLSLAVRFEVAARALPARLTDEQFWSVIASASEPGGSFRYDNLISNETSLQQIIPELQKTPRTGAYLGVGPEQNFTYITALQPAIAFIIDIRRDNMLLHLLYKALIEMSADRAEFLSRLFARQRPAGMGPDATADALVDAFTRRAAIRRVGAGDHRSGRRSPEGGAPVPVEQRGRAPGSGFVRTFCADGPGVRGDFGGGQWIPSYARADGADRSRGPSARLHGVRGELPDPEAIRDRQSHRAAGRRFRRATRPFVRSADI